MDGGLNSNKQIMLCKRPNEVQNDVQKKIHFYSRVDPKDALGINPVKKEWEEKPRRVNMVLKRHKDWLEVFKLKMKYKREMQEDQEQEEVERFKKIKEQAALDRQKTRKMKEEFNQLNKKIMQDLDDNAEVKPKTVKLTAENLKRLDKINSVIPDKNGGYQDEIQGDEYQDQQEQELNNEQEIKKQTEQSPKQKSALKKKGKSKPKWAYTEKEMEQEEEDECDELLDFVDGLNYDKYIDDLEVQTMIKAIKNRVDELKQDKDWKKKAREELKEKRRRDLEKLRQEKEEQRSEINSQASFGEARSVASSRTQESIQNLKSQLKDHKQKKNIQWDNSTQGGDNKISVEDKIAKLVADEILRNYRNLSAVHSNQSIRKLLEQEAGKHLQPSKIDIAQRYDGPNINVVKERTLRKDEIDPNNLPYMHRNPAI